MSKTASIIGFGSYLPEKVLSNADLEKMVDTNDEWIFSRTGMKERRIASDDQATSDLGYESAKKAIADAEIAPEDIELIIFATLSPDYAFPSTSCIVQERLGCSKAAAMDVQAACTGYIYALAMAKGFIESGTYKNILVVAAEKLSSIVNYKDRGTCVLFGDGASAAVISSEKKGYRLNGFSLGADGKQSELLILPAGGSRNPTSFDTVSNDQHYLQMEGKEVFKHAVRRMEAAARECLEKDVIPEDLSKTLPKTCKMFR